MSDLSKRLRARVATMLEHFGYELLTPETADDVVISRDGKKYAIAFVSATDLAPTPLGHLTRLHSAVIAANAAAGFFMGSIRMSGVCAAVARAILAELPLARSAYPRDPHAPGRGLTRQEDGQQISSFSARPRLRGG
jgi:hypothetical protein